MAEEPQPAATTSAVSPTLLREWSYNENQQHEQSSAEQQQSVELSSSSQELLLPPVAPAIVLSEADEPATRTASTSSASNYPVATYVSNLVRSSIDQIYATAQWQDPTSVRSEDVNHLRTAHLPESARTVTSEPVLDGDSEYVLVDGDLIAIPPAPYREELQEEEFHARQSGKARMRRSIRGFKKWNKWMKKRRAHRKGSTTDFMAEHLRRRSRASSAESATSSVASGGGGGRKKNKRRISWNPAHPQRPPQQQPLEHPQPQPQHAADLAASLLDSEEHAVQERPFNLRELGAMPPMAPISEQAISTGSAVAADFIGTTDLVSASVLGVASADAYIEHELHEKTDSAGNEKLKAEELHLDSMLQQAQLETRDDDLDESMQPEPSAKPQATKPPEPLKTYNDTLKIIMVGGSNAKEKTSLARALSNKKPKRPRSALGVDIHTWTPPPQDDDLKFSIWDVISVNAGAHPATQSLFYSADSLYILIWDLAAETVVVTVRQRAFTEEEEDDDEDDYFESNDFIAEQCVRQADRALEADINENVLSWLDVVATTPGSAILPVAMLPIDMDDQEAHRRCSMLQAILLQHPIFAAGTENSPNLIFGANDAILKVNLATGQGIPELQETVQAIGREHVFPHVGKSLDSNTMEVLETVRRLKQDHKVILLDHLLSELKTEMAVEKVTDILHFLSSIGQVLYYGNSTDEVLSRYIILSRKWLVSALSCILRPDLQRELGETRRFMNLQCVFSGEAFVECDIVQTLLKGTNSSCPLLSAKDAAMLWQSMSFMREAADQTAQLSEASSTMYDFLERLLVHSGILLPLAVSGEGAYFVPSLLPKAEPGNIWTYKTSDSWMTTLCHSWLLRDGAPSNVMEHVTTSLLQDLYEFSNTFQGTLAKPKLHHAKSFPMATSSLHEVFETHDQEAIGRIKIHQVMCWKSSILVKIGTVFADHNQGHLRESFSEIYVSLVDDQSTHCVATDGMTVGQKRLIVCGKGSVGFFGRKLWKGGYALVLDSIKAALADFTGVDRQVICPECLAHFHPSQACTWSWDNVISTAQTGNSGVRCVRGHHVNTNLLCGTCAPASPKPAPSMTASESAPSFRVSKPVSSLLSSVVLVGLWDPQAKRICSIGSGFIVDKKQGLIITAGHVLFDMVDGRKFGLPYFGLEHARVVVGVIPDDGHTAVFRYFGELMAHDIQTVDACVVRITTKMENDVKDEGEGCALQAETALVDLVGENLPQLKMTRKYELEESVRILGFNQGGEGVLEQGKHVNRSVDFAKGYVCKRFASIREEREEDDASNDSDSSMSSTFAPREEIVVMCPTISGHSGGPCVNGQGKVIGILSRADPVDRQRCYVVPACELKILLQKAKSQKSMPLDLYPGTSPNVRTESTSTARTA